MEQQGGRPPAPREGRRRPRRVRAGDPPGPRLLRRIREPRVRVAAEGEARPCGDRGRPRPEDPGAAVALDREGAQPPRPPGVLPRRAVLRAGARPRPEAEGGPRVPREGEGAPRARGPVPRRVRVLRHVRGGGRGMRGVRNPGPVRGGDEVTLPSAAEVEHADWPALKAFAADLGLNPKGRSGIVRQRVLDHVRTRTGGPSWRAGKAEQAALLTRIGPADLAANLWESTITLDAPAPWVGLGTAYLKAQRIEEALKCYDRAISMGDAGARLHKAQALMRAGRSDAAIAEIDEALVGSPGNVRAWAMRAALAEAGGDSEVTVSAHRQIADLGHGRLGLAKILMRAGEFMEAEKALSAHLAKHPRDGVAWNNRGVCLAKRTIWKDAVEAFRRAVSIDPRGAGAQNNLAVALAATGRVEEAVKRIASARRIVEDPRILLNEAALRERKGTPAAAREAYAAVLEVAPEHPEAVAGKRRVATEAPGENNGPPGPERGKPQPKAPPRQGAPKS